MEEKKELLNEELEDVSGGMRIPFEKHISISDILDGDDARYSNPLAEDQEKDAPTVSGSKRIFS